MKSENIESTNIINPYYYKKITKELIEDCISKCIEDSELKNEPKFVFTIFGTVESTTKWMQQFNKVILNKIR